MQSRNSSKSLSVLTHDDSTQSETDPVPVVAQRQAKKPSEQKAQPGHLVTLERPTTQYDHRSAGTTGQKTATTRSHPRHTTSVDVVKSALRSDPERGPNLALLFEREGCEKNM